MNNCSKPLFIFLSNGNSLSCVNATTWHALWFFLDSNIKYWMGSKLSNEMIMQFFHVIHCAKTLHQMAVNYSSQMKSERHVKRVSPMLRLNDGFPLQK